MIDGLFGSVAWGSPMWSINQQQMYNAWNNQAHTMNRLMNAPTGCFVGMQNCLTPKQRKLRIAHEIAADVRSRHPEMQVKRLGNDCAARSD